jgi:hypothetical protein
MEGNCNGRGPKEAACACTACFKDVTTVERTAGMPWKPSLINLFDAVTVDG